MQTVLKDLQPRTGEAAANLELEEPARLRDEIKRLKELDLEFDNEITTAAGEEVDRSMPAALRKQARAEQAGGVPEGAAVGGRSASHSRFIGASLER